MTARSKFVVDGHVHVYQNYDPDVFFQTAVANMEKFSQPGQRNDIRETQKILLFTEGKENDFFSRFKNGELQLSNPDYKFQETKEKMSLVLMDKGKPLCYILKGRQIVSKEKLEVLAVATAHHMADGLPIREVLEKIVNREEIAVLAWGVGKWFLKRGKIINQILNEMKSPYLFVGDNSARPGLWPMPGLLKIAKNMGIPLINGSDPLPFETEVKKVVSYVFTIKGEFDSLQPGKSFRDALLANPESIRLWGSRDSTFSFFKRQFKMFVRKHFG